MALLQRLSFFPTPDSTPHGRKTRVGAALLLLLPFLAPAQKADADRPAYRLCTGAGNPTVNRVANLDVFDSNLTFSMSPGLLLRDGMAHRIVVHLT